MSDFWIKYALRVAHIGSMIGICYKTISDFSAGTVSSDNALLYSILGVVTILSGFANTFLLQPKKMGEKRKLWIAYHHIKLLITMILYLPTGKLLFSVPLLSSLRMYWIISIIIVSPYMRFYREKHSDKTRI